MARAEASFRVLDRTAPRRAVEPAVAAKARRLASDAAAGTPVRTGRLRAGWNAAPGRMSAAGHLVTWEVSNQVPYARYVEFGTRRSRPRAMLGRALVIGRTTPP